MFCSRPNVCHLSGQCNPNPCLNNGECEQKGNRNYKCDCPRPFKGRRCEKGMNNIIKNFLSGFICTLCHAFKTFFIMSAPKRCRKGTCGRGECVLTSTPPFYECKCKEPFQPPHCRTGKEHLFVQVRQTTCFSDFLQFPQGQLLLRFPLTWSTFYLLALPPLTYNGNTWYFACMAKICLCNPQICAV